MIAAIVIWKWQTTPQSQQEPVTEAAQEGFVPERLEDELIDLDADMRAENAQAAEDTVLTSQGSPATTPQGDQAVLEFAHRLSGMMVEALESEESALPVFSELETCAEEKDGATTAELRLICFANASKLAAAYPDEFGEKFDELALRNPTLVSALATSGL